MSEQNDDPREAVNQDRRKFLRNAGYTAAAAAAMAAGGSILGGASAIAQPTPPGPPGGGGGFPEPPSGGFDGMRVVCPCFGDLINLVTSEGTFPLSGKGNVGVVVKGGPDPNEWGLIVEQHEVTANDTPFGTITIKMADSIEVTKDSILKYNPANGSYSQTMFLPISVELEHCGANKETVTLRTLPNDPVCLGNAEPQYEFPPKDMPYMSKKDVGLYAMGSDGQVVGSRPIALLPTFSWTVG